MVDIFSLHLTVCIGIRLPLISFCTVIKCSHGACVFSLIHSISLLGDSYTPRALYTGYPTLTT